MDILQYLGTLNPDVEIPSGNFINDLENHPFQAVFEAIDVINYDLNQLAEDRHTEEKERILLERQLAQVQKREALGTLAGGIAHDFNNILSGMFGYCQLAKVNIDNPRKVDEQIEQIRRAAIRAAELVKQILIFSRKAEYQKEVQDISVVVKEAVSLLRSSIPVTITIQETIHSRHKVLANAGNIHQIVMNLGTNAYQAVRETGGKITVSLEDVRIKSESTDPHAPKPGEYVGLTVTDTGTGMSPEVMSRIFDPYFTTRDAGKGTGMGLSMVYAIIQEHNGHVRVESEPGEGTCFRVYFPAAEDALKDESNSMGISSLDLVSGNEHIMVVDDEAFILNSTEELLKDSGYTVTCFDNGLDALRAFAEDPQRFDLVITDMTMPGLSGDTLAANMLAQRKDLPVILCSGFNDSMDETKALKMGIRRYVQKPLIEPSIEEIVREVLDDRKPPE